MKEKESKSSQKKVWKRPTLTHLPIKNTKGGGVVVNPEDDTYNPEGS